MWASSPTKNPPLGEGRMTLLYTFFYVSTHCTNSSRPKPGTPRMPMTMALNQLSPRDSPRDGGGQIQQPHRPEAQGGVERYLQRQLQRRGEQPQGTPPPKTAASAPGRFFFYDRHDFPPFMLPAGMQGAPPATGMICAAPGGGPAGPSSCAAGSRTGISGH